jgi:diamine N-acetyltransferase
LRGVEPRDLDFLYRWENDPAVWSYGDCGAQKTFARADLRQFIDNQQHDIYITGQQRLVICRVAPSAHLSSSRASQSDPACATPKVSPPPSAPIGFIDLFDFDPVERRAGVGILICDATDRGKGSGREALQLTVEYARRFLGIRELWCNIEPGNAASLALFLGAGFERIGQVG